MNNKELMIVKDYLDTVAPLNHIANVELVAKWKMAYKVVYEAVNGKGSYHK